MPTHKNTPDAFPASEPAAAEDPSGLSRREFLYAAGAGLALGAKAARAARAALPPAARPAPLPRAVADAARPLPLTAVRLTGGPLKHAQDNVTTNTQAAAIQWLLNGNPPPSSQIPVGANDPYAPAAATSSFTWNFPAADGSYTIAARGFDANGNSGTTSSLQVVLNRHQATPPASINAGWDNLINGVDVQWVPSIDKDILYYTVYHQYGANAPAVVTGCGHVTGTSCTDLTAPSPNPPATPLICSNPPQTYATTDFYWVVGVDTDPVTGQPRVSTLTSPKVDANICDHRPNAPIGLVGAPLNGAMTLTWVAAPIADPDAGDSLLGWRVYRWPTGRSPQFPGDRLALVGTLDSSGHPLLTYSDSTADPLGVTQTYCVTSVDTHMNESPCSLVVSG